jgi:pimeloyl-ACP methyl ester carboxylesterase
MMRFKAKRLCVLAAAGLGLSLATLPAEATVCKATGQPARQLITESYSIPSDSPGIDLYVRNKRPADMRTFASGRILLYVHGATYPSETAFDLPLDGLSWMDYIACQGWDVYLVDLRGYGQSTRPPEMAAPPADNKPVVTTEVAVRDVSSAVEHVLARRGVTQINLLGWSWGTSIMGTYAATNAGKVKKLVLYAPLWLRKTPSLVGGNGPLGAYRTVTKEQAKKRWLTGVPEDKQKELIPAGWFEAWADMTWATDPLSAASGELRAPNGVVQDVRDYWSAGKPYYDPRGITADTLLIHGEWDQDTPPYMAQAVFELLLNSPRKRLVVIGEATHSAIMEKNRMQLFREVQLFLEELDAKGD